MAKEETKKEEVVEEVPQEEAPEVPVFNASVNPRDNDLFDKDGFVGVDPIYQNYANDTEKPYAAEGGDEAKAEKAYFDSVHGAAREPGEQLKALYGEATKASE